MSDVIPNIDTIEPISYTRNITERVNPVMIEYNTNSVIAVIAFIFLMSQESQITSHSSTSRSGIKSPFSNISV